MDLSTLLAQIEASRDFFTLANAPVVQFGPPSRPLLGPTLLPERTVDRNEYTEEAIRYKTLIANSGTRYSPAQKRPSGVISGSFLVQLGHQDVMTEYTSRDYDALIRYLRSNMSMEAAAALIQWVDTQLVQPLVHLQERDRWDAIVNAQVTRAGDNGDTEIVPYPNPTGHRVAAGGTWSNDAYDPYDDIMAQVELLYDKGYEVDRFITSRKVAAILRANAKIGARAGSVRVLSSTDIVGRATLQDVNDAFAADDLPPIEIYDGRYQDLAGTHRFLADDVFVLVSTTGNDESVALPNGEPRIVENILGYHAIGLAAGSGTAGRSIYVQAQADKPPRIEGQAWQASLPVILEPEAIAVITGIA
jgi:hypothetical protein